jgi:3-oxoacyl-[acyl-carrier protein] reductase
MATRTAKKSKPIAIVTGAAQGIGLAISKKLAEDGFHVIALDIHERALKTLGRTPFISPYLCDVGDPHQVVAVCEKILKDHGTPWALINNAGWGGPFHRLDEVSDDEWTRIFNINVRGAFTFSRELLPAMAKKKKGRIVNIASIQGLFGAERSSTYIASKHALIGYTKAIAVEWGPMGIACNAICPGYIDTHQGARSEHSKNFLERVKSRTPVGRTAKPQEVAELVAFLVSPKNENGNYLNGSILTLDGGITAGLGL